MLICFFRHVETGLPASTCSRADELQYKSQLQCSVASWRGSCIYETFVSIICCYIIIGRKSIVVIIMYMMNYVKLCRFSNYLLLEFSF